MVKRGPMLGICFSILTLSSVLYAAVVGNAEQITSALFDGAARSVEITVALLGITALWSGFLQVLMRMGALRALSRVLLPVLRFAFPDTFPGGAGAEEIAACVSANLLGVSNAATPFALRAMEKMATAHGNPTVATRDMITLVLLSSSGLSLFPTSVVALRRAAGSLAPTSVLLPVWIVSAVGACLGIVASRVLGRRTGGERYG